MKIYPVTCNGLASYPGVFNILHTLHLLLLHDKDTIIDSIEKKGLVKLRSLQISCNFSNCKRKAWEKFRLQRDSNAWLPDTSLLLLPTELQSHILGVRHI